MKNLTNVTKTIIVIISLLTITSITAQNINNPLDQEKESDGYLVYFEPDVTEETIDSIMNLYNSYEEWITPHSKVRYWKVNSFPFSINDTTDVSDMEGIYDTWVNDNEGDNENESELASITFNYMLKKEIENSILDSNENNVLIMCSEYYSHVYQGNYNILIDVYDTGYDFINENNHNPNPNIEGGFDFVSNDYSAQDYNGHGTHITSIISTLSNNEDQSISLYESKTHNSEGIGKLSDIVRAIDHSIDIGAKIINASWSFYALESIKRTPIQVAIETAGEHGILFVTAAGNDAIDNDNNILKAFPASYPSDNIIAVSSNACDTTLSYFSNYGFNNSDICAIGENIPGYVLNNQIALMSGTSQATAYVSAAAAIIGTYLPEFNPVEVKELIMNGAAFNDNLTCLVKSEAVVDLNKSISLISNNQNQENPFNLNTSNIQDFSNEIYPNPFNEHISINLNVENYYETNIAMFDVSGKQIINKKVKLHKGNNEIKLDNLEHLVSGVYYINTGFYTKKLIKIK